MLKLTTEFTAVLLNRSITMGQQESAKRKAPKRKANLYLYYALSVMRLAFSIKLWK